MICNVELTHKVHKQILKLPQYIQIKLFEWVAIVRLKGLGEVQKTKGYHDEPLSGHRKGQRSIRLNRAYRAIYEIKDNGEIKFIELIEVNKHDYRKKKCRCF